MLSSLSEEGAGLALVVTALDFPLASIASVKSWQKWLERSPEKKPGQAALMYVSYSHSDCVAAPS